MCEEGNCIAEIDQVCNDNNLANYEQIAKITVLLIEYHKNHGGRD